MHLAKAVKGGKRVFITHLDSRPCILEMVQCPVLFYEIFLVARPDELAKECRDLHGRTMANRNDFTNVRFLEREYFQDSIETHFKSEQAGLAQ